MLTSDEELILEYYRAYRDAVVPRLRLNSAPQAYPVNSDRSDDPWDDDCRSLGAEFTSKVENLVLDVALSPNQG